MKWTAQMQRIAALSRRLRRVETLVDEAQAQYEGGNMEGLGETLQKMKEELYGR